MQEAMRRWRRALIVASLGPALHAPLGAQEALVGPKAALSPEIRLQITTESSLLVGNDVGEGMITSLKDWARIGPRGRIFLIEYAGPAVSVFSPEGSYLKTLGSKGEGPMEFRFISNVLFSSDSTYVVDGLNARITVFDSDLRFVRTSPLGVMASDEAAFVNDSVIVMNAHVATAQTAGHPLQLINRRGEQLGSIGGEGARYNGFMMNGSRRVAVDPEGVIWSARTSEYVVDAWDVHGRHLRRLTYEPDFFQGSPTGRDLTKPPPSMLLELSADADGYLWVITAVGDERWESAIDGPPGTHQARIVDYNLYYDCIIEVIDPRAAKVVARKRVDELILFGDERIITSVEGSLSPRLRVRRLGLAPLSQH